MATGKSLDALLDERAKQHEAAKRSERNNPGDASSSSAALPPTMQKSRDISVDELLKELNRVPLFMTNIDETDGEGGENIELEALKALAYEGSRAEIAQNFREQGTELIRQEKRYKEAREFYTKALTALKEPRPPPDPEQGPKIVEIDDEAEALRERNIEEVCLVNRALCNLEMRNYGFCKKDCAAALQLNPRNVKAWYRAASACMALDQIAAAIDACSSGLQYDSKNAALKALLQKAEARKDQLAEIDRVVKLHKERIQFEEENIATALKHRNVITRETPTGRPDIPYGGAIQLEDPLDPSSSLSFPVLILYPVDAQMDFIGRFHEDESLNDHLAYVLPPPWDDKGEYKLDKVDCYMETIKGGLIKAGKKIHLLKFLNSGKVEVVDELTKFYVVPRSKATKWIEEFKLRSGEQ